MNFLKYTLLLGGLILFSQCSDEDPMDLEPEVDLCAGIECGENGECIDGSCLCEEDYFGENCEKKKGLLKSISMDGEMGLEFSYLSNNKISNRKAYFSGQLISNLVFRYDDMDTLFIEEAFSDFYIKVYKENENTVVVDEFYEGIQESRVIRIFNECGVVEDQRYNISNDELSYTHQYEHVNDNCSFIKTTEYANGNILKHIVSIDGNRNNIVTEFESNWFGILSESTFVLSSVIDYKLASFGNVIENIKFDNNVIDESSSYTIDVEFNEHGYPSKKTRTYLDGTVEVYNYTYWE